MRRRRSTTCWSKLPKLCPATFAQPPLPAAVAATNLEFEKAAHLRDEIARLKDRQVG